jgi:hypothetical protein
MTELNTRENDVKIVSLNEVQDVADEIGQILWGDDSNKKIKEDQAKSYEISQITRQPQDPGIEKLIYNLSKEIAETRKENRDLEEISRLKEVALAYNGDDKLLPFSEIYDGVKLENETEKSPLIKTGFEKLDKIIKKFKQKHLIILAGIMKHGKTSLAIDITTRMKEWNPLWLPIEEGADELMEKFLDRGEQPPHGFAPLHTGVDVPTNWIEKKVVEGIVKYGCKIVFIDNLDWIKSSGSFQNDSKPDRITQACKEIKEIAKKWNVAIILLCHVNKNAHSNRNPTFDDIKGSSGVGQVGDKVILLWRQTISGSDGELEITNNANISVQANRQGGVGNVKMTYENGHYVEFDWKADVEKKRFGDYGDL